MGVLSHFSVVWGVTMPTGQGWHLGKFQLCLCAHVCVCVCVQDWMSMSVLFPEDSLFYRAKNNFAALEAKKKKKTLSHTHGWSAHRHACTPTHRCTHTHTQTGGESSQLVQTNWTTDQCFFPFPPLSRCFLQMSDFTCLPRFSAELLLFFSPASDTLCYRLCVDC